MRRWRSFRVDAPPLQENPAICRWCLGRRLEVTPGEWICQVGCSERESRIEQTCAACRGTYQTGQPLGRSDRCWQCERKELAQLTKQWDAEGRPLRGYAFDEVQRGANRRAMEDR